MAVHRPAGRGRLLAEPVGRSQQTFEYARFVEGVAGIVGFGTEDPPGLTNLSVHLTDTLGQP